MKKLSLLAFLFIVTTGFAQKTTLKLSSFNDLDVFGPFDVELIKSDQEYAEINFNGIDKEDIIYETQGETLKLKLKNRHYMNEWKENTRHSKYILVKVYYIDIDKIEASAGAVVTSKETLKSKYLTIECDMGAEVTLDVYAMKIAAIANMGGVLELTGQTDDLQVKANMGAVLKASHLESKTVYVKANMGADVIVNATDEIDVSAGFGSSVDYVGGPSVKHTHTSKNFGAEVNRRGN